MKSIKKEYGETSLEAMLHDGKVPYLHMRRMVALESAIRIRQFRKEWFTALKLLFGKTPLPKDLGVDTTGAISYWARVRVGFYDNKVWVYALKVSRNALMSPAINRVEIIAHEAAHLFDYYNKYVKRGRGPSQEEIKLGKKFDFIGHGKEWQALFKRFYKKLKTANIVEADSEYEKHAAMLLEKRRQAWADPEWSEKYKDRMKNDQLKTATAGSQKKTRKKAKEKPKSTGRVKAHRRRTGKGKKVSVQGYQRKPRRK